MTQLLEVARLQPVLDVDAEVLERWKVVKDWNESSRYKRRLKTKAEELYAVTDRKHGVLTWIKARW